MTPTARPGDGCASTRRIHFTSKDGLTRIENDGNSIGIINHLQPASGSATVLVLVAECGALKIALKYESP
jgi:hypothetical protein